MRVHLDDLGKQVRDLCNFKVWTACVPLMFVANGAVDATLSWHLSDGLLGETRDELVDIIHEVQAAARAAAGQEVWA